MTLTAPGCGMGDVIAADARNKILGAPQISKVHVDIVFDPPWSREMMSEEARLELGMF
jgi:metal-sulfur cluster biosynthetic enzyme